MASERVRRVQELRRSSAAGPQADTPTRSAAERAAIGEQLADAQPTCVEPLPRVLTVDDPEPPIGSVLITGNNSVWQRSGFEESFWETTGADRDWIDLFITETPPLTLIHEGTGQ